MAKLGHVIHWLEPASKPCVRNFKKLIVPPISISTKTKVKGLEVLLDTKKKRMTI